MQENGNDILMLFTISSLLIFIILVLVFLFVVAYQRKMVSQRLHIQQAEVDHQQELLQATVEVQEKERKRIASDLHDDIGALLSALRLNVKHLKTLETIGEEEQDFLSKTSDMLDDGLENVRRISYDLLPPTLARFGFLEAINELAERIKRSQQIDVQLRLINVQNKRWKENIELSLFRVIQELIANTLHHSKANVITILIQLDKELKVEYFDDGKGITDASQLKGLGMINMQSRIQSVKGTMKISGIENPHFFATIVVPVT